MNIHPEARTTAKVREEIHRSHLSNAALARQYNVHRHTIAKWRKRNTFEDGSHRPKRLNTTLTPEQEWVAVELRKTLMLPIDDLLVVVREFINADATRSGLQRLLSRHGVPSVAALKRQLAEQSGEQSPKKHFKDYAPGFIHVDLKYLPVMPGQRRRRYLLVAIDRATRWVYLETRPDKTALSARRFLRNAAKAAPFRITTVLTDNGKEFTDRLFRSGRAFEPSGQHEFDQLCAELGIEHRLTRPRHPQTNGMVERFNGRISELLKGRRFDSEAHMESLLADYRRAYNQLIAQRALGHKTPIQALKKWQEQRPELFTKKVYDHPGLDMYILP